MIRLHHLRIGRSLFTIWQLEELGADYDLTIYLRDENFRAPAQLKEIHPLGKSPVIEDGELILSESSAITTYLLEKFDTQNRFAPPRTQLSDWAKFTQWLHYPEGSVFAPLLIKMLLLRGGEHAGLEAFSAKEIALHLGHISNQLGENDYILGSEFSAADFGVAYVVSLADRLGQLDAFPTLKGYLARCTQRPAFARAVEKGIE
jgi:glutathione S-transferase